MNSKERDELKREMMRAMFRFRGMGLHHHGVRIGRARHHGSDGAASITMAELTFLKGLSGAKLSGAKRDAETRRPGLSQMRDYLSVSKAGMSQMLGGLEQKGLVTREIDPENRRKILVHLTPLGEEMLASHHRDFDRRLDEMIARLGEDDTRELIRLIDKLAVTLDDMQNEADRKEASGKDNR